MIAALLGALAGLGLWWVLRDHRSDDPQGRHPSTGPHRGYRQPCHVRIVPRDDAHPIPAPDPGHGPANKGTSDA